jgi:hypothetical protein
MRSFSGFTGFNIFAKLLTAASEYAGVGIPEKAKLIMKVWFNITQVHGIPIYFI